MEAKRQTHQCQSKMKTAPSDVMKCNLNEMKNCNRTGFVNYSLSPSDLCFSVVVRRPAGESDGDHESGDRRPAASGRILRCTPRGLLHSQVC